MDANGMPLALPLSGELFLGQSRRVYPGFEEWIARKLGSDLVGMRENSARHCWVFCV
jgi:hypothetical protein